MIEKSVSKRALQAADARQEDLKDWMRLSPEARVAAVDDLRGQYYDSSARLQRVALVIQRPSR